MRVRRQADRLHADLSIARRQRAGTHDRVMAKMNELSQDFPEGVAWEVNFDTTPYTRESINEVFKALRDAVILVAIVVLVFLQNWRSAIIPLVAVPVAIIGTFAAMAVFGFSLNNLTLFGLVLAIGIVVDDAIVVVEAVEHHIEDGPCAARGHDSGDAAGLGAGDRRGPGAERRVRAVRVYQRHHRPVLSAVRADDFRLDDHLGVQFADAQPGAGGVAAAAARANDRRLRCRGWRLPWPAAGWAGNACRRRSDRRCRGRRPAWRRAALARGRRGRDWAERSLAGRSIACCAWRFRAFNAAFDMLGAVYTWIVGKLLHVSVLVLMVYGGLLALTYQKFDDTPKGFIPAQDMGYLLVNVQLPDSASAERTAAGDCGKIEKIAARHAGHRHVTGITGQSFALNAVGSNFGSLFIGLDDYDKRRDPELSSASIVAKLERSNSARIHDAMVQVFPPPPVRGVGRAGGFTMMVEDRGDVGSSDAAGTDREPGGEGQRECRSLPTCFPSFGPTCRSSRSSPTCASAWKKESTCAISPTRCRFIKARCTSTTSICSAARGR